MFVKKPKPPREVLEEREKTLVREYFEQRPCGVVVDVGANEPVSAFSQSWHLEEKLGWKAVLVEPNPVLAARARSARPNALTFECACCATETDLTLYIPVKEDGAEIPSHAAIGKNLDSHSYAKFREVTVRGRPLDHILEEAGVQGIDLLSIDVEGAELEVLKGFDIGKYRPGLILLEDKHLYLNKHRYLTRHGYRLCKRTGLNCWYVPQDARRPPQSLREKARIFKRLYLSIWWKKLRYALRAER